MSWEDSAAHINPLLKGKVIFLQACWQYWAAGALEELPSTIKILPPSPAVFALPAEVSWVVARESFPPSFQRRHIAFETLFRRRSHLVPIYCALGTRPKHSFFYRVLSEGFFLFKLFLCPASSQTSYWMLFYAGLVPWHFNTDNSMWFLKMILLCCFYLMNHLCSVVACRFSK